MRLRTPTGEEKLTSRFTPGPQYNNVASFSPVGRYIVSNYK